MMVLTQTDQMAIRTVISEHLQALQASQGSRAFALTARPLQQRYKSAANFVRVIRTNYPPLCQPRSVVFESLTYFQNIPTQLVMFLSQRSELFRAIYLMEKQSMRRWLILDWYWFQVEE